MKQLFFSPMCANPRKHNILVLLPWLFCGCSVQALLFFGAWTAHLSLPILVYKELVPKMITVWGDASQGSARKKMGVLYNWILILQFNGLLVQSIRRSQLCSYYSKFWSNQSTMPCSLTERTFGELSPLVKTVPRDAASQTLLSLAFSLSPSPWSQLSAPCNNSCPSTIQLVLSFNYVNRGPKLAWFTSVLFCLLDTYRICLPKTAIWIPACLLSQTTPPRILIAQIGAHPKSASIYPCS